MKAKKSLGQHWLVSQRHVNEIIAAAADAAGVLEIGPGKGVLTAPLTTQSQVLALELDADMLPILAAAAPDANVIQGDVLRADLHDILRALPEPRAVVSNLPYYITAAVVSRLCELSTLLDFAVLMMQEEVAARITAPAGDPRRGSLSVTVQRHFELSSVCKVPAGAFSPPPKVDSRVLRLHSRKRQQDPAWEAIVRRGFSQPRKTLANCLGDRDLVAAAGLSLTARPHQLREEDWNRLADAARNPRN